MRATALLVKNVLGMEEIRIEPGQLTKISGANGSGKSSILAALQAAIGGGNLQHLKRVGAEEDPEVVLVLDDGRFRIERKGDDTVVKQRVGDTAGYDEVKRPQAWLNSLFDPFGTNPLRFLQARPQDRTDILLEVLPLKLDRDALVKAIGDAWPADKVLPEGHALHVLAAAREELFNERTGINRTQKDKASYAYEANKALPAEMPADPVAALQEAAHARDALFRKLSDKRAAAETAEEQARTASTAEYEKVTARVEGEFKAAAAKLRTELARKIAILTAETETAIQAERTKGEEILKEADQVLERADAAATAARQKAFAEVEATQPELQDAERRVAELNALSKNVAKLQEQKRLADKFEGESEDLKLVSQRLTKALETVEVFKTQLLAGLPIEGLEIRGKEIYVNGIHFDSLNTAARYRIAVKVAVLRAEAQALKVLFIDGAEALDKEHFDILEEELVASGVQAFLAKVEEGPLSIETRNGPPAKVTKMPPPTSGTSKRRQTALTE
jgi:hypothetical protein